MISTVLVFACFVTYTAGHEFTGGCSRCIHPNGHQPHTIRCDGFCHCSNGHPHFKVCPHGLHFNPRINVCDHPHNVHDCPFGLPKTTLPPTTTTATTTATTMTTTSTTPPTTTPCPIPLGCGVCVNEGNQPFYGPYCNYYCACDNGCPYVAMCPNGLIFDSVSLSCGNPEDIFCPSDHQLTSTSTTTSTTITPF